MTTFVSSLSETELTKTFADHYGFTATTDIDALYTHALNEHSIRLLAPSSKTDIKGVFDAYEPKRNELRFSLPFTFTFTSDDILWIKHTSSFDWYTLQTILKQPDIKTAMLLAPVVWQLGPIYFQECYKANVVASAFDAGANVSSADLVLKNHPIELLVTTSEALKSLIECNSPLPKHIMVIEAWGKVPFLLAPDNSVVVYDIHLVPGVPIAFQDKHSVGSSFDIKPIPDYLFTTAEGKHYVSSLGDSSLALFNYELPAPFTSKGEQRIKQTMTYV